MNRIYLVEHRAETARETAQLAEGLFENGRERQEPQSVPGRGRVEHDDRELHRLDLPAGVRALESAREWMKGRER